MSKPSGAASEQTTKGLRLLWLNTGRLAHRARGMYRLRVSASFYGVQRGGTRRFRPVHGLLADAYAIEGVERERTDLEVLHVFLRIGWYTVEWAIGVIGTGP